MRTSTVKMRIFTSKIPTFFMISLVAGENFRLERNTYSHGGRQSDNTPAIVWQDNVTERMNIRQFMDESDVNGTGLCKTEKSFPCSTFINEYFRRNRMESACTEPKVLIQYSPDRMQGLSACRHIILYLTHIARALCAGLLLPPPCKLLDPKHNFGTTVDCRYKWDDYFQFSPSYFVTKQWTHWDNSSIGDVASGLKQFSVPVPVLTISTDFWAWPCHKCLLRRFDFTKPHAASAVNATIASRISGIGDTFLNRVGIMRPSQQYIAMHIRRGDSIHGCNSSISRVVEAVSNCTAGIGIHSRTTGSPSLPLIFWTDEKDSCYIDSLQAELRRLPHVDKVVHADPILSVLVGNNSNNYDVFMTENHLKVRAKTFIQFRRNFQCGCEVKVPSN